MSEPPPLSREHYYIQVTTKESVTDDDYKIQAARLQQVMHDVLCQKPNLRQLTCTETSLIPIDASVELEICLEEDLITAKAVLDLTLQTTERKSHLSKPKLTKLVKSHPVIKEYFKAGVSVEKRTIPAVPEQRRSFSEA